MEIFIYADWIGLDGPKLIGTLSASHTKEREVFSFAYERGWIDSGKAQILDSDLQLLPVHNI